MGFPSESRDGVIVERAGFEPVDHTADVAVRVWADSLEEFFRQAARGMMALLTDPARVEPVSDVRVTVTGIDLEELLIAWLGEILYRFDTDRMLLVDFQPPRIERTREGFHLSAGARGASWDPARHAIRSAVKAATYHGLRLEPGPDGRYDLVIVFDT
jgi:SHS2 domain-containing protein